MAVAYIGIGSNLGNREENCKMAIHLLEKNGLAVKKQSSFFETQPWGVKDQPMFINMAIETETALLPYNLLRVLKGIEKDMGRKKTRRWGPRVIDLDILMYDDLILKHDDLVIPHQHLHVREFALGPLCEIAPERIHPEIKKTMRELLGFLLQNPRSFSES
jgi:2-amino-4-hydroxy-6-hydroxymethyldihydropteridine diphosphokinase